MLAFSEQEQVEMGVSSSKSLGPHPAVALGLAFVHTFLQSTSAHIPAVLQIFKVVAPTHSPLPGSTPAHSTIISWPS
jgi:hypothetical protein